MPCWPGPMKRSWLPSTCVPSPSNMEAPLRSRKGSPVGPQAGKVSGMKRAIGADRALGWGFEPQRRLVGETESAPGAARCAGVVGWFVIFCLVSTLFGARRAGPIQTRLVAARVAARMEVLDWRVTSMI